MNKAFYLALLTMILSGCYSLRHEYKGPTQITPGTRLTAPSEKIGHVEGSRKAFFLLAGLIPIRSASGPKLADDLAQQHFSHYHGITRVRIEESMTAFDVIVNSLIGLIFGMITVEVDGEVHRFREIDHFRTEGR